MLARSLVYIGAYAGARLVGFVYIAWDGGIHGFLLTQPSIPTMGGAASGGGWSPRQQPWPRRTAWSGSMWDYEPPLETFYQTMRLPSHPRRAAHG